MTDNDLIRRVVHAIVDELTIEEFARLKAKRQARENTVKTPE